MSNNSQKNICPSCGGNLIIDDQEVFCENYGDIYSTIREIEDYLSKRCDFDEGLDCVVEELINHIGCKVRECKFEKYICKNDGRILVIIGEINSILPKIDRCPDCGEIDFIETDNLETRKIEVLLKNQLPNKKLQFYYHPTWDEEHKDSMQYFRHLSFRLSDIEILRMEKYLIELNERLEDYFNHL